MNNYSHALIRVTLENHLTRKDEFERYFKWDEYWKAKEVYKNIVNSLNAVKEIDHVVEDPTFDNYAAQTRALVYNTEDCGFDTVYTVKMERI